MAVGKVSRSRMRGLVFFAGVTFGFGWIGWMALPAGDAGLQAPPLVLPPALRLPVGLAVYAMMALSAYLAWDSEDPEAVPALRVFLLQLAAGAAWPWLFFVLRWRLAALLWGVLLTALLSLMLAGFRYVRPAAYRLAAPAWFCAVYILYLSIGFHMLNA